MDENVLNENNKRPLDETPLLIDMEEPENEPLNPNPPKKICISQQPLIVKNSVSILNELKQVQPKIQQIEFKHVSQEGPSHDPLFTHNISFRLNNESISFNGTGNSKPKAKLHASVIALDFLLRQPDLFTPFQIVSFHNSIVNDFNTLKIDLNVFYKISNDHDTSNASNLKIENMTTTEINPNEAEANSKKEEVFANLGKILEQNFVAKTGDQHEEKQPHVIKITQKAEAKVNEYLQAKNLPSLFNYLVPNECCFFNLTACEGGCDNSKVFQTELHVKKEFPTNSRNVAYRQPVRPIDKNNALIKENEPEFIFHGYGKSKAQSKANALRTAIEYLFTIKLDKFCEFSIQYNQKNILKSS